MSYLIAVYPNEVQALSARAALEKASLPREQISILGKGYKSVDEYGLIKPSWKDENKAQSLAYWLVPCGFTAGYAFNYFTNIEILNAGSIINQMIEGLFGALCGLLGAFALSYNTESHLYPEDTWLYRERLDAGKYLILFAVQMN